MGPAEHRTVLGQATAAASTAADHQEQLEHGLTRVACDRCGAEVRVKKNSPAHTSIQWTPAAVRTCPYLAGQVAEVGSSALADGCERLQECIDQAERQGRLVTAGDATGE